MENNKKWELQEKKAKERIDNNLYNANIKLLDENRYLKEDNEKLMAMFIEIRAYINSLDFKSDDLDTVKMVLKELIEKKL